MAQPLPLRRLPMRAIPVQPTVFISRRQTARLLPTTNISVDVAGLPHQLDLRDLSYGGFAIIAARPFWMGMTYRFTFKSAAGLAVALVAKAVHCYRLPD